MHRFFKCNMQRLDPVRSSARRRTAEKRVAKLMAKVWAQRASKLEAGKAGTSLASLMAVETGIVQTVLARAAR